VLLIVTNKDDFTADFMIQRLIEKGLPYFRLNSDELYDIQYELSLKRGKNTRKLILHNKFIDLNEVTCVWYRRKISPPPSCRVSEAEQRFAAGELQHFVEGLVLDSSITWVNPIGATDVAEKKVLQLRVAQHLGFNIPDTLISNSSHKLDKFIEENNGKTICKPIYHGLFCTPLEQYAVYTHNVTRDDFDGAEIIPTLLQREVPKGNDIRLTIIGKDVYPVEIYSSNPLPLDWRKRGNEVSFKVCSVPSEIVRLCHDLLDKLNLVYGAFDFVRTPDGEWVFLEVNPTGEWAWLEIELSLPMSDSFIKVFYAK
jgi:hypothetical protein